MLFRSRLALEQTLCLGAPLPTMLITLSRLSEAMVVICANPRQMRKLHTASQRAGLTVEPLFYTCWMHRALKEATRLPPEHLEEGHYLRLLRLCIERRSAPALRRLFAQPADADHTHPSRQVARMRLTTESE